MNQTIRELISTLSELKSKVFEATTCRASGKIVVYTAIFGDYDELREFKAFKDVDFVCFTDQDIESKVWSVRKVKPVWEQGKKNSIFHKLNPHKLFPKHDYSVWVDGTLYPRTNPRNLVGKYLKCDDIAMFSHREHNSVLDEVEKVIELGKDNPENVLKQFQHYKEMGYIDTLGMGESTTLLRRHNVKQVKEFDEFWWREYCRHDTTRDQLSLMYSLWKTGVMPCFIDGNVTRSFHFHWNPHKSWVNYYRRLKEGR